VLAVCITTLAAAFKEPVASHGAVPKAVDEQMTWGPSGHATVAAVAMGLVTSDTARCVHTLVGSLPPAARWADVIKKKRAYHWSKSLHYATLPPWVGEYLQKRDCHEGRCVVTAISNYTKRLADVSIGVDQRREAIKFLSHFIGDIHQPLHLGFKKDAGGNRIRGTFMKQSTNLHKVWDDNVIELRLHDFASKGGLHGYGTYLTEKVKRSIPKHEVASWRACSSKHAACPKEWAQEAAALAVQVAYKDAHGQAIKAPFKFGLQEYNYILPYIETQIMKGGVRLANVLNGILGKCTGIGSRLPLRAKHYAAVEPFNEAADSIVPESE